MLYSLFLIGSFGTTEMLLIAFVVILLFGAKRIPELFRGMGQGVREFKDASKESNAATPPVQPPYPPQVGYQQPAPPTGYPQPDSYQQPVNPNEAPRS